MPIHVFGIRHHGPGCARSLRTALEELRPDVLVLEAPGDAEPALPLIAHAGMIPPVALLLYPRDEPKRSVFYPFTLFSPEWQALRWACAHDVPVRLMDLPMAHRLALDIDAEQAEVEEEEGDASQQAAPSHPLATPDAPDEPTAWRTDPIALLAEAAGYRDHELWWEEQIERRADATGLFEAILEAMRTVRRELPETRGIDLLREAFMRKTIRAVRKSLPSAPDDRIAVVCGAWHAPVLDEEAIAGKREGCRARDDNARLKGLPKIKTTATWIPWTHSRLSYRSGYGAGVTSPGWYAHLWESPELAGTRWLAAAARLLREKDLDASSASVIEATRLADTLAAMRELRAPGLAELNEAILTVLCHGDDAPLRLIRRRLEIGDRLGTVPEEAPAVPLSRDLQQVQKSLRLKPSTENKLLDLDLRKEIGLGRSHLLHRLNILGIPWGELQESGGALSTFHEIWQIEWEPEFAVSVIEANVWGNTIDEAATARVVDRSREAAELAEITRLLDVSILAGLDAAVGPLLQRIQSKSALSSDVSHLMDAVLPLARVARYGDVRGTRAAQVEPILTGMFERIIVGLTSACSALDEQAAERMLESLQQAQAALDLLHRDELHLEWLGRLRELMTSQVHGLIRGWSCRLLLEKQVLDAEELHRLTRVALSPVETTAAAAAWISGLLRGSGLLLIHQDALWPVMDRWLIELEDAAFVELLPVLRRAFSGFSGPERRQMGEKLKRRSLDPESAGKERRAGSAPAVHHDRAAKVLPVLARILGTNGGAPAGETSDCSPLPENPVAPSPGT